MLCWNKTRFSVMPVECPIEIGSAIRSKSGSVIVGDAINQQGTDLGVPVRKRVRYALNLAGLYNTSSYISSKVSTTLSCLSAR
jgi:hypothetical protein